MKTASTPSSVDRTDNAAAASAPNALDAAFADLPELLSRVDQAESRSRNLTGLDATRELVARITEQMRAIQQQRERLARLLSQQGVPCDL
jgi:hypothetical protein